MHLLFENNIKNIFKCNNFLFRVLFYYIFKKKQALLLHLLLKELNATYILKKGKVAFSLIIVLNIFVDCFLMGY